MDAKKRAEMIAAMIDLHSAYPGEKTEAYIKEVMQRMIDSGVPKDVVESQKAVGCIARGVDDLMRPDGELSEDFKNRLVQLTYDETSEAAQ